MSLGNRVLIILLFFTFTILCNALYEFPVVRTPLGRIKGSLMKTRLNKTIYSFRGVRYAEAPEGERRFKPAEFVHAWDGIFDASKEGPACPNPELSDNNSEDCLRLNIYVNKLPTRKSKINRPVIVFVHPGSYVSSSSQSHVVGPQYLLDHNIVLVTVNYRLGFFGFTATGDANSPGNQGLKDQVQALRWVQKNIAAFGGNPNSVTLMGSSAGSLSVIFHMLSPLSKGLFHRGIAMSAAPTLKEPLPSEQRNHFMKMARLTNCSRGSLDETFACLRTVPFTELRDNFINFMEWGNDPSLIWSPVVEPEIPEVERFLSDQPDRLIRMKNFTNVPLIIGITKDEFSYRGHLHYEQALLYNNDSFIRDMTEQWEYAAPISFEYERESERSRQISRAIKKFYFNDEPITVKNGENLGLIYSDGIIGFPVDRCAKLLADNSVEPVYYYQFTYQGRNSFAVWKHNDTPYGVMHLDDTQYLFYMQVEGFPLITKDDPENEVLEKLTTMWVHFVTTGKEPIPKGNEFFGNVRWEKLDSRKQNYLEIGLEIKMKTNMFPERYELWEKLFPLRPI